MDRVCVAALCLGLTMALPSDGWARPASAWSRSKSPARGPSEAIGGYSNGCVRGAAALKRRGDNFRLARPRRRRNFGHPLTVSFVEELAAKMKKKKLGSLSVGDLSQPRGGPAPSGHASHQSGLDADLWYLTPTRRGGARTLVDRKRERITRHWSARVRAVLELAATDARVARIFVHPIIKRELCRVAAKPWLRKLRPWWGHDSHFHVRLACPPGDDECEPQAPLPLGDGCAEIDWWLSQEAKADRAKSRERYRKRIGSRPKLPPSCTQMIQK